MFDAIAALLLLHVAQLLVHFFDGPVHFLGQQSLCSFVHSFAVAQVVFGDVFAVFLGPAEFFHDGVVGFELGAVQLFELESEAFYIAFPRFASFDVFFVNAEEVLVLLRRPRVSRFFYLVELFGEDGVESVESLGILSSNFVYVDSE